MAYYSETHFNTLPNFSSASELAIFSSNDPGRGSAESFLRFGSWVGGDRDGNPSVTAKVTEETMAIQAEHVLLALENATTRIGRSLTVDEAATPPSRALRKRLATAAAADA